MNLRKNCRLMLLAVLMFTVVLPSVGQQIFNEDFQEKSPVYSTGCYGGGNPLYQIQVGVPVFSYSTNVDEFCWQEQRLCHDIYHYWTDCFSGFANI